MRIYILPVDEQLQPNHQPFTYPAHNDDFGVEQDFFKYLVEQTSYITNNPDIADWHYLPVFWTRWHLNHNYGKEGREQLQQLVSNTIIDPLKTFTICQYSDGPLIDLDEVSVFLSSRQSNNIQRHFDMPLLSTYHKLPFFKPRRKYIASFMGRFDTHPIRVGLAEAFEDFDKVYMFDGNKGTKAYIRSILSSWIVLCPRGYGGSSFRFYEAMQLGRVPLLIGDLDTRPFKDNLPWDEVSFYASTIEQTVDIVSNTPHARLELMGSKAKTFFEDYITFQKWCPFVLKQLGALS